MIKPLRVLIMYAALLTLAVILATVHTIRTEEAVNTPYTETGTAVYLEEHPWAINHADINPLSEPLINAD